MGHQCPNFPARSHQGPPFGHHCQSEGHWYTLRGVYNHLCSQARLRFGSSTFHWLDPWAISIKEWYEAARTWLHWSWLRGWCRIVGWVYIKTGNIPWASQVGGFFHLSLHASWQKNKLQSLVSRTNIGNIIVRGQQEENVTVQIFGLCTADILHRISLAASAMRSFQTHWHQQRIQLSTNPPVQFRDL